MEVFKLRSFPSEGCLNLIIIAIGAVPGALIRWQFDDSFFVNILGAGLIGFVISIPSRRWIKLSLCIGFCGSLTTFSGWMMNALKLLLFGFYIEALKLIFLTFFFGLLAAILGSLIAKMTTRLRLFQ